MREAKIVELTEIQSPRGGRGRSRAPSVAVDAGHGAATCPAPGLRDRHSSYCSAPGEDFDEDAEGQEEEDHAPTFGSSTTYVPLHEESSIDASARGRGARTKVPRPERARVA